MNYNKILVLNLFGMIFIALLLSGCSSNASSNETITIDAPDEISALLTKGAGDNYTYYANKGLASKVWDDVSKGTLWICSVNRLKRPPLIPNAIINTLNGGGFKAGTLLTLSWTDQPPSSELHINKIKATVGVTYEGCTKNALKELNGSGLPSLLLTDTNGTFDGKGSLVIVKFY